jgi:hypothetical protein
MIVPAFYRRSALLIVAIFLVSSGCTPSPTQLASQLLGRWQRVGENSLSEPYVFAEYVEFRPDGQLIELLWDPGPQQAWTVNVSHYAVSSNGGVEFSGSCWRGWERYPCAHTYAVSQAGASLRIVDKQDRNKNVQYRRIADLEPEPPPTLAPPSPSPTPAAP